MLMHFLLQVHIFIIINLQHVAIIPCSSLVKIFHVLFHLSLVVIGHRNNLQRYCINFNFFILYIDILSHTPLPNILICFLLAKVNKPIWFVVIHIQSSSVQVRPIPVTHLIRIRVWLCNLIYLLHASSMICFCLLELLHVLLPPSFIDQSTNLIMIRSHFIFDFSYMCYYLSLSSSFAWIYCCYSSDEGAWAHLIEDLSYPRSLRSGLSSSFSPSSEFEST